MGGCCGKPEIDNGDPIANLRKVTSNVSMKAAAKHEEPMDKNELRRRLQCLDKNLGLLGVEANVMSKGGAVCILICDLHGFEQTRKPATTTDVDLSTKTLDEKTRELLLKAIDMTTKELGIKDPGWCNTAMDAFPQAAGDKSHFVFEGKCLKVHEPNWIEALGDKVDRCFAKDVADAQVIMGMIRKRFPEITTPQQIVDEILAMPSLRGKSIVKTPDELTRRIQGAWDNTLQPVIPKPFVNENFSAATYITERGNRTNETIKIVKNHLQQDPTIEGLKAGLVSAFERDSNGNAKLDLSSCQTLSDIQHVLKAEGNKNGFTMGVKDIVDAVFAHSTLNEIMKDDRMEIRRPQELDLTRKQPKQQERQERSLNL